MTCQRCGKYGAVDNVKTNGTEYSVCPGCAEDIRRIKAVRLLVSEVKPDVIQGDKK